MVNVLLFGFFNVGLLSLPKIFDFDFPLIHDYSYDYHFLFCWKNFPVSLSLSPLVALFLWQCVNNFLGEQKKNINRVELRRTQKKNREK